MRRPKISLPLIAAFLLFSTLVIFAFNWRGLVYSKNAQTASVTSSPSPTVDGTPEVKGKKVKSINVKTNKVTKLTPSPTSIPSPPPTLKPSTAPSSSVQDYVMKGVNDYRVSNGLSQVKIDSYTCSFAKIRAGEILKTFNHDGFNNRVGSKTLPYPSYSEVTENIAMTSDYKKVVPMWIASSGHAENMRRDTPYVCVVGSGSYWAYEGWKP